MCAGRERQALHRHRAGESGDQRTCFTAGGYDTCRCLLYTSKRYGVLFYPIVNKVEKTGTVEIMAKARDAKQINRIFERMGYPAPVKEDTAEKKENARAPSENSSICLLYTS